jgi:putative two-component system response regulator
MNASASPPPSRNSDTLIFVPGDFKNSRVVDSDAIHVASQPAKIMIVDDEPINLKVSQSYLEAAGYSNFVVSSDDQNATTDVQIEMPDLVILDVMMPHVSGLDILAQLRDNPRTRNIPVLILTASTDRETRLLALQRGATDFLAKPVDPSELIPRVRNALLVKSHQDHLGQYADRLEAQVRQRTLELELSRREIIECLASAAEYRDNTTGHHIVRVGKYAAALARAIGLPRQHVSMIEQASQLHDVGKIGIPDDILRKHGRLNQEEFALMKRHCIYGQKILQRISDGEFERIHDQGRSAQLVEHRSSSLVELAASIALTHHEFWDGNGYPAGLKGEEIPLEGRITAVADVFDALASPRCYKPAFNLEACLAILNDRRGTQFEPRLIDALHSVLPEFESIRHEFADTK